MSCKCGYEFCYKCGGKYLACECNKRPHIDIRPIRPIHRPRPILRRNQPVYKEKIV